MCTSPVSVMSASSIGSKLSNAADQVAADAHPWVEPLARAGYSAKALLYATIGFLAAGAALMLHPVQAASADPVVQTATFDAGTFTVPAMTTAVFVLPE